MMNIRHIIEGRLADQLVAIMLDIDAFKLEKRRSPLSPRRKLLSLLPKHSRKDVERNGHFTEKSLT